MSPSGNSERYMENWVEFDFVAGPRRDFGCVKIDDHRFFICGGQNEQTGLKSCSIWDCENKSSTPLGDLPNPLYFCRAVFLDGFVYVLGSNRNFFRMKIDDISSTWELLNETEASGIGFALVVCDKLIYQIAGFLQPTRMNCYNPETNKWEKKADLPSGRRDHDAVELRGEIYVVGGLTVPSNHVTGEVLIFCHEKGWKKGPKLPRHSKGHSITATGTDIFLIGGQPGRLVSPIKDIYKLDTLKYQWTVIEEDFSLPKPVTNHRTIATNHQLFVMGGCHDINSNYNNHTYGIDLDALVVQNDDTNDFPTATFEHTTRIKKSSLCSFFSVYFNWKRRDLTQ